MLGRFDPIPRQPPNLPVQAAAWSFQAPQPRWPGGGSIPQTIYGKAVSEREPIVGGWISEYPDSASRVMIDAGANIGEHTIPAAQRFQHVYAVEPHDETFKKLCNATANLDNVTPVYRAIDRPGPLSQFMPEFYDATSFDELWQMIKGQGQTVGLIKCDIEGAEDRAWDNATQLLYDNHDWLWIILELHRGVNFPRLHDLFIDRGYSWSSGNLHHAGHYLIKKAAPEGAAC